MRLSKTFWKTVTLLGSLSLVLSYNACGAGMPINVGGFGEKVDDGLNSSASVDLNDPAAVQNQALQILATNCTSCHLTQSGPANVFNVTDSNHLIQSGLVVPGNPDASPLITSVEGNLMPPTAPLSGADKTILRQWVAGGAQPPAVPPALPPTQPPSQPPVQLPPTPTTGSLEEQAVTILQNNCFACHGTVSNGGVTKINDPAYLISAGLIVPGNAAASQIYDSVSTGRMPAGGHLSSADIAILADWINAGAKAPSSGTVTPPPPPPPLEGTYNSLNVNVFAPKCVGCHGSTVAKDGIRMDSYTAVLRLVRKGDPSSSKLYTVTAKGEMPERPNQPLSSDELKALSDWIKAGAPNN